MPPNLFSNLCFNQHMKNLKCLMNHWIVDIQFQGRTEMNTSSPKYYIAKNDYQI